MACGTLRTLTWCVSARVLANVTSQSTHRGPSLVGGRRDVKRDREGTPGSEAAPPRVLPRALEDDEGNGRGTARARRYDAPSASLCETTFERRTWGRKCVWTCRPKLDGHTHSRLSVIYIIKKKEREKSEKEKVSERERKKKQEYIVRNI